jgi:hypothetical protein
VSISANANVFCLGKTINANLQPLSIKWFAALCALLSTAVSAATLNVNFGTMGNNEDNDLSFAEALGLANGSTSRSCWKRTEINRISGANWELGTPLNCPQPFACTMDANQCRWTLRTFAPNIGVSVADNVVMASNFSPISLSNAIFLARDDLLDGLMPNGDRLPLAASAIPSAQGYVLALGTNTRLKNVEIFGAQTADTVQLFDGVHGAHIESSSIHDNAGNGIALRSTNISALDDSAYDNTIGGSNLDQRNFIFNNGNDGVLIQGDTAHSSFAHANKVLNNFIAGNQASAVAILDSRGNVIGQAGAGNALQDSSVGVFIAGDLADGNIVCDNLIGGAAPALANTVGVRIENSPDQNLLACPDNQNRNRIIGNRSHGVYVLGASTDNNVVRGNHIGLNGSDAVGNGGDGIRIEAGANNNTIESNVVVASGVPTPVNADSGYGIQIQDSGSNNNLLIRNQIGLKADLTVAGNARGGIRVRNGASLNDVGGDGARGNTIVSNAGPGITIDGEASDGNRLRANQIGVYANVGWVQSGNSGSGILIQNGADATQIGVLNDASARNTISANTGDGIEILGDATDATMISSNYIGLLPIGFADAGNARSGVYADASDQIVLQSNVVSGNNGNGIELQNGVSASSINGNFIGSDSAGLDAIGNGAAGIAITGGTGITVGTTSANIIVANGASGVLLSGAATTNVTVANNDIGFNASMNLGNAGSGVLINNSANNNTVRNNRILANAVAGIDLNNADNNFVHGNFIGAISPARISGNPRGIRVFSGSADNVIGGPNASVDRNLIVAGTIYGVGIFNTGSDSNTLQNNYIGEFPTGEAAGFQGPGVWIQEGANANQLVSNVIAQNGQDASSPGVRLRAPANATLLLKNIIARNFADGVEIDGGSLDNRIGGAAVGDGNLITGNAAHGIDVVNGSGNFIRANTLLSNALMAINLGTAGVNSNDPLDADTGPNQLQNYPLLSNAVSEAGSTSVQFNLNSAATTNYETEFFYSPGNCAPGGGGQGQSLGLILAGQSNAQGFFGSGALFPGARSGTLSALSTDVVTGDSSELGSCIAIETRLFRNGFESTSVVANSPAKRSEQWLQTSADGARWILDFSALDASQQANELVFHTAQALGVHWQSDAIRCEFSGALRCRIAANADRQSLRLVLDLTGENPAAIRLQQEAFFNEID